MKTLFAKCLVPALMLGAALPGTALLPSPVHAAPFYQNGDGGNNDRTAASELTWGGDVDDTTLVSLHHRDVRTRTVHGKDADNVSTQIFGRLPEAPIYVFLRDHDGRGSVRVVQQPTPDNDFTAVVRVHDPQRGRSHYDFTLAWRPLPPPGSRRFGY